ncbi:MAG: type I-C CRISPR-associated endonuclease Cas1c [Magnetococcus sp. WYHC-3]
MKSHLNTLFITTPGTWLAKDGECVDVRLEHKSLARIPIHTLDGIACFGPVTVSPYLLAHCGEHGVALSHFDDHGRFLAALRGPVAGNVLLRREQYRWADREDRSTQVARNMLRAKLRNGRTSFARALRDRADRPDNALLDDATQNLKTLERSLLHADSVDSLRGIEGRAAALYWAAFPALITRDHEDFHFGGRSRRPPLDRVNALLSFLYALLLHDIRSALEGVGLDPFVGFLHRDRPGRAGLALDMMEEFRPFLPDRLALGMINRGQLAPHDFEVRETGATFLNEVGRKKVLVSWHERKQEELTHPYLDEKCSVGVLPHLQSLLLARHIRGDLDGYPAFLWH